MLESMTFGQMLRPGFEPASPADTTIPQCVHDAGQAVAVIREHHARWLTRQARTG